MLLQPLGYARLVDPADLPAAEFHETLDQHAGTTTAEGQTVLFDAVYKEIIEEGIEIDVWLKVDLDPNAELLKLTDVLFLAKPSFHQQ